MDDLPSSCTPVIFADVNDGIGLRKVGSTTIIEETTCISNEAARLEHWDGGAGEQLRAVLELHSLAASSSWHDPRDTFFGDGYSSLLDHLFIPRPLIAALRSSGPLYKLSKRLQCIRKRGLADHSIVHTVFYYVKPAARAQFVNTSPMASISENTSEVRWNTDAMARCLREGEQRHVFIAALEKEMERFLDEETPLLTLENTPDSFFTRMDEVVIGVAQQFFSKGKEPINQELADLTNYRLELLRQRRDMREGMVDAESSEAFSNIVDELVRITKLCKAGRLRERNCRNKSLIEELWEHWHARRMAECHRTLRALGSNGKGPKQRSYSALRLALPTTASWLQLWEKQGKSGGMLAKQVDWDAMLDEHRSCAPPLPEAQAGHTDDGRRDVARLAKHCVYASKRKSCPTHSVPVEILAVSLSPNVYMKLPRVVSKLGLGSDTTKITAPATRKVFNLGYKMINQAKMTPLKWHSSWGAGIPKPGSTPGPQGLRVVHRLDEQGKAFYSMKMKSKLEKRDWEAWYRI